MVEFRISSHYLFCYGTVKLNYGINLLYLLYVHLFNCPVKVFQRPSMCLMDYLFLPHVHLSHFLFPERLST